MNKKSFLGAFCLLSLFLLFHACNGFAKIFIDINSPYFQKIPVMVQDPNLSVMTYENRQASQEIVDTLSKDLLFQGFFSVFRCIAEGQNEKIDYKVTTDFARKGRTVTVILKLYDLSNGTMVVGRKYIATLSDLKKVAHRFANEIVLSITGHPGVTLSRIVFVSENASNREIYSADFDGTGIRQETWLHTIVMSPRYSPDGRFIAFTSFKTGRPCLYIKAVRNGSIRKLACFQGVNMSPAWHPSGKRLAVTLSKDGSPDIYLLDIRGQIIKRLTHGPGINVSPSFSPDGARIVFVSDRAGGPQLYIMNVSSGRTVRLTYSGSYNTDPEWSPCGDRIIYVSRVGGKFQVFTISSKGGDPLQLTFEGNNENPSWSPDGRQILFSSDRTGGNKHLFVMQANGQDQRLLLRYGRQDFFPFWGPNTFK